MKVKFSLQYLKTWHLCHDWAPVISAFIKKILKLCLIFFSICFFLLQAMLNEVRWVSSGLSEYSINGLWKICFLRNNLTHNKICHMYFERYSGIISSVKQWHGSKALQRWQTAHTCSWNWEHKISKTHLCSTVIQRTGLCSNNECS